MLAHQFLARWKKKMYMLDYYDRNPQKFGVNSHKQETLDKHAEDLAIYRDYIQTCPIRQRGRPLRESKVCTTTNTTDCRVREQKNIKKKIESRTLNFD